MKNIVFIVCVLLVAVLLIGMISGTSSLLGDPDSENTGSVSNEAVLLASYVGGVSDPAGTIVPGFIVKSDNSQIYVSVGFEDLIPGEKYTVAFDINTTYTSSFRPSCYYLRTGGLDDTSFEEISIGNYGQGSFTFTAETESAELFIRPYAYTTDSALLTSYGTLFKENCNFYLYKVGEAA